MKKTRFSRRDMLTLAANVGFGCLAAGTLPLRAARAQGASVKLGLWSSAGPQTFGKATGSFQRAYAGKAGVDYIAVNAAPQILAAIASRSMDICNIGSAPMVGGFARKLPLSMVYVQKIITDSECLAVRADSGIASLDQLKGKRIGLPFNTSVHFAMLAALKTVDLRAADVRLINIKPDALAATWKRGDIDAAFIWRPVLGDLLADGGRILLETGDLARQGVRVFDGIVAGNEFKEKHPDLLLAYLVEYDRICAQYRDHPEEVVKVMANFLNMAPETTRAYIRSFHSLTPKEILGDDWMGRPGASDTGVLRALRAQGEFLVENGQIPRAPADYRPYVDASFVARMA